MSWNVRFIAESKAAAAEKLVADKHVPEKVAAGIVSLLVGLPDEAVEVSTNGHVDQFGGNAHVEVRSIVLVRAKVPEPAAAVPDSPSSMAQS